MNRNDYETSGFGIFGAVIAGAILGAAAMFFSDERNKRKLQATINDWREKGEEKMEELREEGLEKASEGLSKAQTKLNGERRKINQARSRATM